MKGLISYIRESRDSYASLNIDILVKNLLEHFNYKSTGFDGMYRRILIEGKVVIEFHMVYI